MYMSCIKDKFSQSYVSLQYHKYQLASAIHSKDGQAVMEYALIFFIAGLGMAASLSMIQSNIEASLYNQLKNLEIAGKTLF